MTRSYRTSLLALAGLAMATLPATAQSTPGAATRSALASFGGALAAADGDILVGEPGNQARPGMVYVYRKDGDGWAEAARLTGSDAERGDGFGASLAVDGATLLVGGGGGVHVFRKSGGSWTESARLTGSDVTEGDAFGAALALRGDLALVGAPGRNDQAGAVYVFRRQGSTWTETGTIALADGGEDELLGASLALDGSRALVGAPGRNDRTGTVHVYEIDATTGTVTEAGEIAPRGGQGSMAFGAALALRGDDVLVGAPAAAEGIGFTYRFRRTAEGWEAGERLLPFQGGRRVGFGAALAFAGDRIWVGAPNDGAVYSFAPTDDGAGFAAVERVIPPDGPESSFGATLVVGDDYAAFGLPGADWGAGQVAIFEATGSGWTESARVLSEDDSFERVFGGEVECADGEATAFGCQEVDLVAYMPVADLGGDRGINTNDVWGWTDPETGREYALVGLRNQASFVDISDPAHPVLVGELDMTEGAQASSWRDIKTYDDHAFIVSDGAGQHGMQVFDLTRLREFDGEPIQFQADALYDRIASAHNIVVNTGTGYAFAVGASSGGETCGGGLHMIDVRDPKNPTFAGCFADPQTGRSGTGYTHDAQCVTYEGPDADYQGREICFGANETALSIADVTDKANPVALSRASYPNVAYSHQGWLTEDHRFFYMNDELDEIAGNVSATRTLIWDVTDLEDPQLVDEYLGTTSASDHNLYVVGDRMYQSNYRSGLRILDVSDPVRPREVGYFDTVPYGTDTPGMGGSWSNYPYFESGVVIVTSGREGLFIVRPRDARTIS